MILNSAILQSSPAHPSLRSTEYHTIEDCFFLSFLVDKARACDYSTSQFVSGQSGGTFCFSFTTQCIREFLARSISAHHREIPDVRLGMDGDLMRPIAARAFHPPSTAHGKSRVVLKAIDTTYSVHGSGGAIGRSFQCSLSQQDGGSIGARARCAE